MRAVLLVCRMFRVFERNSVGSARLSRRWIERVRGGGYESRKIKIKNKSCNNTLVRSSVCVLGFWYIFGFGLFFFLFFLLSSASYISSLSL